MHEKYPLMIFLTFVGGFPSSPYLSKTRRKGGREREGKEGKQGKGGRESEGKGKRERYVQTFPLPVFVTASSMLS